MNGAGYMIEGELTMHSTEDPNGSFADPKKIKTVKLKPGDAWAESVNCLHYGENLGTTEVRFVVVFAGHVDIPPTLSLGTRK
jgi:hypothetical protein